MDIEKILTEAIRLGGQDYLTEAKKITTKQYYDVIKDKKEFDSLVKNGDFVMNILVGTYDTKPGDDWTKNDSFIGFCNSLQENVMSKIKKISTDKGLTKWLTDEKGYMDDDITDELLKNFKERLKQQKTGNECDFHIYVCPTGIYENGTERGINVRLLIQSTKGYGLNADPVVLSVTEVSTWLRRIYYKAGSLLSVMTGRVYKQ